ncbi:MAG: outer membrane protein assembly factor BamD, partial [Candidatus Latescibacteria bacterium]|nr:outer membrane protein assembly factor BamD [Candidatus Latescibacterota bacterium]
MKPTVRTTILWLGIGLFAASPALAQQERTALIYNPEAQALFQRAHSRYIRGSYLEARQAFQELIDQFPPNQCTSAARLMLAKSHYKLREYNLATAAAYELYEYFPYSRYLPEADLVIGDCYFHQAQVYSAAAQYARILTTKADVRLKAKAADRLGQMAGAKRLTDRDVGRLKADFGRAIVEEAIDFGQARWPQKLGRPDESLQKLDIFLERYPNGLFGPQVRKTLVARR